MRNIIHTSSKQKVFRGFVAPMFLGLMLSGCIHQPVVKPIAGVSPQEPKQDAITQCKAETTLSLKEQLDLINKSLETFGDTGREAGTVSDIITKDDKNSGAKTGENVGKSLGTVLAVGALVQDAQEKDDRFQVCMHKKGYDVIES